MTVQSPHPPASLEEAGGQPFALWRYQGDAWASVAEGGLEGFGVEADDEPVGTVTAACDDQGGAFIVARGGAWNGGLTLMVPAGLVERIDGAAREIRLRCSREQIGCAPAFENDRYRDGAFRSELTAYYASLLPSAFRLLEAAARRAGSIAGAPGSFGLGSGGYPQTTVS